MNRLVKLLIAAAALLAVLSATLRPVTASHQAVKNIVLVHGAWADGSSWSRVIPILEAWGFHTIAVQNPLTSLDDDVAATSRAIANQDGSVLLVGHSYGGAVITQAGNDPKVAGLVYVAAFAPDEGQSVLGLAEAYPTPGGAELEIDRFGFLTLSPAGIRNDFAQDLFDFEKTALVATQGPTSVAAVATPITSAAWKLKPSWYMVAKNDRMVDPNLERLFASTIHATTVEIASSHVVPLSHPFEVAAFIRRAALGG